MRSDMVTYLRKEDLSERRVSLWQQSTRGKYIYKTMSMTTNKRV
jgi:hypothetical protein